MGGQPWHLRDSDLLTRLRAGKALRLIGAGRILQQLAYVHDVAEVVLGCASATDAHGRLLPLAGPETVEARRYYELIAETEGARPRIEEARSREVVAEPADPAFLAEHRAYGEVGRVLAEAELPPPGTRFDAGMRQAVACLQRAVGQQTPAPTTSVMPSVSASMALSPSRSASRLLVG